MDEVARLREVRNSFRISGGDKGVKMVEISMVG